jgi:hypothetical protein
VGNNRFQLARFKSLSDDDPEWLEVEYLGTTKAGAPYAFMDVWVDPVDDKTVRSNVKPRGHNISSGIARWTGIDPAAHVLKCPIALTSTGALTAATLKALGKWKPHLLR